jgi:SpoIIAA-like
MIEQLSGLPTGVIGFEVSGKVTAEDFRDVVLPAVEEAARSGDVRFVVVIPEFHGMTPGALWQDLKVGMENFRKWKRIALITDIEWMHHMTTVFGWMTPGEMKTFPTSEREQATTWVTE